MTFLNNHHLFQSDVSVLFSLANTAAFTHVERVIIAIEWSKSYLKDVSILELKE